MNYALRTFARNFLTLGLIAVLLTGFLGVSHMGMTMGPDGKMTMADCPFMSGSGICNMSPLEHVAMWQGFFASIPHALNQTLALLLVLVSALGIVRMRFLYPPPKDQPRQKRYYVDQKSVPVINVLQELFSCGILNPKPF